MVSRLATQMSASELTVKPRIMLVAPALNVGGAESYVASLALSLHRDGYDVSLASLGGSLAYNLSREHNIHHYTIPVRTFPHLAAKLLARALRKERIDLVHANLITAAQIVSRVCTDLSIPWVATAHNATPRPEIAQLLARASRVIGVSGFMGDYLLSTYGLPEEKVATICCGIDTQRFAPRSGPAPLRKQLGLTDSDFLVGVVARLGRDGEKGHDDLLDMLSNCPYASKWHLAVAGSGPKLKDLKKNVRSLGIGQRVHLLGRVYDVPNALHAFDAVSAPTAFETFGLSIAEGMAMGKPVVAYDVGAVSELIENGRTGILVTKGDVAAMGDALNRICLDRTLGRKLGSAARERIDRCNSLTDMIPKVEELYYEVMSESMHRG